ncbi:antitoxin VbhA family protein [Rhizobiaceae bacterium BDR2-2]|uniref:Antitoxin VbhA family protein n=1 Tax=Ectorhizobium quercum TaxID=2965071 RepID=A0AAE3MZW6_9HYPH|nr:antitoxin VbhA family protein [Ectorhizobium quercum]MCX8997169.1 antitoxin VbhA family protein [Ectorhizobium quercum]
MSMQHRFTQIEVVDNALSNLRLSGHEPDAETIAFIWKIARGEVSGEEIDRWKADVSRWMRDNNESCCAGLSGTALPATLDVGPIMVAAISRIRELSGEAIPIPGCTIPEPEALRGRATRTFQRHPGPARLCGGEQVHNLLSNPQKQR